MAKYKLEYIWLDGYEPVAGLRSKTKIADYDAFPALEDLPVWNFDGSSTRQAPGGNSDCLLQPVAAFPDPARDNGVLVMCEVMNPDGTPHASNSRATIPDDPGTWFGFEQEYFLYQDGAPLGFPGEGGFPPPQGEYYTGVGFKNVGNIAREIVEQHIDLCLEAGINHEGINAEVAKGQWEFQIFGKGSKRAADEVWVATSPISDRCAYAGVIEHSVYVAPEAQGRGVGRLLLEGLIVSTEAAGIWTIQSGIFPENVASLALHERCGFRQIGVRERIGRLNGVWRDVVAIERRSVAID